MSSYGVQYCELNIDSRDADSSGDGGPTTDWPVYFKRDFFQTIVGIKVLEVTLPFSYYTINSETNVLPLRWNDIPSFVTIPPGNYIPSELVSTINPLIATAITSAGGGGSLVLSYSTVTNLFTFTFTAAPADSRITFNINSGPPADATFPQNHPGYLLGFYLNDNVFGRTFMNFSSTTTAAATANLSGPDYLCLRSNLAGNLGNSNVSTSVNTPSQGLTIATFPVDVNRNEVIQWQNPIKEYFSIFPIDLTRMEFRFTEHNSLATLRLNGRSFRIKLALLCAQSNVSSVQNAGEGQRSTIVATPYLV